VGGDQRRSAILIGEKPYDADPLIDTFNRRP
jgi:hypothetical protein